MRFNEFNTDEEDSYEKKAAIVKSKAENFAKSLNVELVIEPYVNPFGQAIAIEITDLFADQPGQGNGSKVMNYITNLSDQYELNVYLSPSSARNREFYNRFGFVDDKRNHRFMVRYYPISDDDLDEMALTAYQPIGDFSKTGPFRAVDKKLVKHPTNQLKTAKFFEKTPYDFRLFFSNIPGTGRYREYGPMSPEEIVKIFGQDGQQIVNGSEDAITILFVGNSGADKVMLTPWMMAHRFGHAIQTSNRGNKGWSTWREAENHFFGAVNNTLEEYYAKIYRGPYYNANIRWDMTPEYNALFNAIGTQRSSRTGQIKRPYEFLYEIFAQYLGTGKVTFNILPTNLTYGRKVFGNPTKYMNIRPEYRGETERQQASEVLAHGMELMFDDVLSSSVGKIFVM